MSNREAAFYRAALAQIPRRVARQQRVGTGFQPGEEIGVIDQLKKLNLLEMTPMDALNTLYELQKRI